MEEKKRRSITWSKELRKLSQLTPNSLNPRKIDKHNQEHLQSSIEIFGMCEPIVVNLDNKIIGGHQRYQVLKKMKVSEVDCYIPSRQLDSDEEKELTIRLNRNQGEWDYEMLGNAFDPDALIDYGFTMEDLHLEEIPGSDPTEDSPKKGASMIISFKDPDHLQKAENRISTIIDEFPGANYKVKVS